MVDLGPAAGAGERYTKTRPHAQGGIGQVWLARDGVLGREVALKELRPEHADRPEAWARFLAEARITGQLEHPGVVPVYELAQRPGDDRPFYAMRFVRGRTLSEASRACHESRQAGRAGPLELLALLNAFVAVCQAVAYAHARGVIHRDLKGDNVVLGDFGEAVVLDWGLAKVVGGPGRHGGEGEGETGRAVPPPVSLHDTGRRQETAQGQVLGTPAYMSPEQAAGRQDEVGEPSDVYGLGALLYEVLTAQAPFRGADVHEILRRVLDEPPRPPRAVVATTPPALEAVCLKALAKNPADRYPSAAALAQDVQRYLAGEPVAAYPEPLAARLGRWASRHRTLVTTAAATLLVALASLALATTLLSAANRKLLAANERERGAKRAAESNYRIARDAVDRYLVKIAKDRRLSAAGQRGLRQDLLEEAGKFYTRFINERGQEPGLELELGHAYGELAVVRQEVGAVPEAIELFQKGLAIFQRLGQSNPGEVKYQKELANGYHRLAVLYLTTGNTAEAEKAFDQAAPLVRHLIEAEPGDRLLKLKWASLRSNLSVLAETRGATAEAEQTALAVVRDLTQAVEADPGAADLRLGLAHSLNNLAVLCQSKAGKPAEAEKYHESALRHFQELFRKDPQGQEYQEGLARTCANLGILYYYRGQNPEALRATRRAAEVAQQLAEQHRDVPEYQHHLASYLTDLGTLYQETDKLAEAGQTHRRALALHQRLADAHPEMPEYRGRLAESHAQLGECYLKMSKPAEAERQLARALALNQGLADAHPDVVAHQFDRGGYNRLLGDVKMAAGDPEAALVCYGRAVERLKAVLKRFPRHSDAKRQLQVTYEGQARAFSRLGRYADALRVWDQAVAVPEGPRGDLCRVGRALTLVRAGAYRRALAEADAVAGRAEASPRVLYDAACAYALSVEAPGLGLRQKDERARRALHLLRQAAAKGFPPREHLLTDKDLDPLRDRADFKQLLAELREKAPGR
jgi:serine/threonine-protein kinase